MKTLILFLGLALNLWAADPQQPSMGGKQLIVATNGYSGTLNVRTQLNVGYPGQAGLIMIQSTNGSYALNLFVDASGNLTISNNNTLVLTLAANSGYDGSTNKFLSAAGHFYEAGGGSTINPTDGYLPYRSNSITFGNSPLYISDSTNTHASGSLFASSFTSPTVGLNNRFSFIDLGGSEFPSIYYDGSSILGVGSRVFIPYLTGDRFLFAESSSKNVVTDNGAGVFIQVGALTPEASITGGPGALFLRTDGGAGATLYIKETGTGNTGWTAIGSGSSGDTIWTNDNGTISANSTVTDGASAVAFRLNSSNALTTAGAKLATFGNGGTNRTAVNNKGGIIIGDVSTVSGNLNLSGDIEIGHDNAVGDTRVDITATYKDSGNVFRSFQVKLAEGLASQLQIDYNEGDTYWQAFADETGSSMFMSVAGTDYLAFIPGADASTTPYTFDTSIAHTSGNLLEVANNGTNQFTVAALTGSTGAGTKAFFDDGTFKTALTINPTDGRYPVRTSATTFGDGDIYRVGGTNAALDGQFIWGPGTTNVLSRSGGNLVYTNSNLSVSGPIFSLIDGAGNTAALVVSGNVAQLKGDVGAELIVGSTEVRLTSGRLASTVDNTVSLGDSTHRYTTAHVTGLASTTTDSPVTIASTGWTNTFGKNAVVYMDGTALVYTVYDNASTPIYTNSVALVGSSVLLQPSGKVIITSGALGVGRATPF